MRKQSYGFSTYCKNYRPQEESFCDMFTGCKNSSIDTETYVISRACGKCRNKSISNNLFIRSLLVYFIFLFFSCFFIIIQFKSNSSITFHNYCSFIFVFFFSIIIAYVVNKILDINILSKYMHNVLTIY